MATLHRVRYPAPQVTKSHLDVERLEAERQAAGTALEILEDRDRRHREERAALEDYQARRAPDHKIQTAAEAYERGGATSSLIAYQRQVSPKVLATARKRAKDAERAYSKALEAHKRLAAEHEPVDAEEECRKAGARFYCGVRTLSIGGTQYVQGEPIDTAALQALPPQKRWALLEAHRIVEVL